jgi:hypothetical protein
MRRGLPFPQSRRSKGAQHQRLVSHFLRLVRTHLWLVRHHQPFIHHHLRLVRAHLSFIHHHQRQVRHHLSLVRHHQTFIHHHQRLVRHHLSQLHSHLRLVRRQFWQKDGLLGQKLRLSSQTKEIKSEIKIMKRNNYYPIPQPAQVIWLANFANKLPAIAILLGLTSAQSDAAVADCLWLIYVMQSWLPASRTWALAGTAAANDAQTGNGLSLMVLPVFTAPALPAGVGAVFNGALPRIFGLVQFIRDGGKCSDVNAADLGIVGTAMAGPDMTTIQPVIYVSIMGTQVIVKWGWGGNGAFLDSCQIEVDRNDGKGYVLLTIDTTPGYTDTQPFPAVSTKWTYRACYRVGDLMVGVWSQEASVMVPA